MHIQQCSLLVGATGSGYDRGRGVSLRGRIESQFPLGDLFEALRHLIQSSLALQNLLQTLYELMQPLVT